MSGALQELTVKEPEPYKAVPRTATSLVLKPGMSTGDIVRAIIAAQDDNGRPIVLDHMNGGMRDGEQFMTLYFKRVGE